MVIKISVLFIGILIYLVYYLYFKNYFRVRKIFKTLSKFLDVRDSFVVKILPDIQNKKLLKDITRLIEERKMNFSSSQNNAILSDVKLNSRLKDFYIEVNEIEKNDVINSLLSKLATIEKDLKKIRLEYNMAVESFNNNLISHKFICLRVIKMKPLDTYRVN